MLCVAYEQATVDRPDSWPRPATGQGVVLVVEDERLVRDLIVEVLEEGGWRVLAAASAAEGLDLVRRERVDLLFTDIDLGAGPSGFDLARVARALLPDLEVVYTSGRLRGSDPSCTVPGPFVPKPYRPTQVRDRLGQVLARPR